MLIQTLVENAVKHGLKEMGGRGHVGVRALRESDHLRIQVEDNGEGFPDGVGQQPPRSRGRTVDTACTTSAAGSMPITVTPHRWRLVGTFHGVSRSSP